MKRMKSMYVRQVAILLGLTFLCMVLLGVGFFTLSYRYQLQEIQTTLDRNAGFISSYADAALTKGGSLTDESFVNYIHSVVLLTEEYWRFTKTRFCTSSALNGSPLSSGLSSTFSSA